MDKYLIDLLNKNYKHENTSYRISKKKMRELLSDCWDRARMMAFDDVINILKDPTITDLDLLSGQLQILVLSHIESIKGVNRMRLSGQDNIDFLIEYTKKEG